MTSLSPDAVFTKPSVLVGDLLLAGVPATFPEINGKTNIENLGIPKPS